MKWIMDEERPTRPAGHFTTKQIANVDQTPLLSMYADIFELSFKCKLCGLSREELCVCVTVSQTQHTIPAALLTMDWTPDIVRGIYM